MLKIGAVMFFTTDSMQPADLGKVLEERGFESLWVPEHTHIPSSRKTPYPAGGPLILLCHKNLPDLDGFCMG